MSSAISAIVLCVAISSTSLQTSSRLAAREQVDTAIAAAIQLLESKDYKTFLMEFAPPDQVKQRGSSPEAMTEWVQYFSSQANKVLVAMKYAKTQTPTYDDAKTTATYPPKAEDGLPSLKMVKTGKYWYLGNK